MITYNILLFSNFFLPFFLPYSVTTVLHLSRPPHNKKVQLYHSHALKNIPCFYCLPYHPRPLATAKSSNRLFSLHYNRSFSAFQPLSHSGILPSILLILKTSPIELTFSAIYYNIKKTFPPTPSSQRRLTMFHSIKAKITIISVFLSLAITLLAVSFFYYIFESNLKKGLIRSTEFGLQMTMNTITEHMNQLLYLADWGNHAEFIYQFLTSDPANKAWLINFKQSYIAIAL